MEHYTESNMKPIEEIKKTTNLIIDAEAPNDGMGGRYYDSISGKWLHFIFSYQMGWEHLSVSMPNKTPTWDQMCKMKDIFWGDDETCIEYHPRKADYVNNHPHCLHIWKPTEEMLPTPPSIMVGFKSEEEKATFLQLADMFGVKVNPWEYKNNK